MFDIDDAETAQWVRHYAMLLALPVDSLWITTSKSRFEEWLGRRAGSSIGGAYIYLQRHQVHAILINLKRIDRAQPRAVEIVVAEELIHMRDWIDGDRRRHSRHGYDRIALKVSQLTGAPLPEIRNCLLPPRSTGTRHHYTCPGCNRQWIRRRKGAWSCGSCSPRFDKRYVLRLVETTRAIDQPERSNDYG